MTVRVVESFNADQYDGTNGTAIAALFGQTPTFDDGSVLKWVETPEDEVTVNVTEWVLWHGSAGSGQMGTIRSDTQFADKYRPLPRLTAESIPLAAGDAVAHLVVHDS